MEDFLKHKNIRELSQLSVWKTFQNQNRSCFAEVFDKYNMTANLRSKARQRYIGESGSKINWTSPTSMA